MFHGFSSAAASIPVFVFRSLVLPPVHSQSPLPSPSISLGSRHFPSDNQLGTEAQSRNVSTRGVGEVLCQMIC